MMKNSDSDSLLTENAKDTDNKERDTKKTEIKEAENTEKVSQKETSDAEKDSVEETDDAKKGHARTDTEILFIEERFNEEHLAESILNSLPPDKPLTETAILRLKESAPEDSVLKDMSNSEVLYMTYKTTGASTAASEMLKDKKKSQSRRLQVFAMCAMGVLAIVAVVAAILLISWFVHDETNDVTIKDSQIYGTWYTETGATYTFNENNTMMRTSSTTGKSEAGTFELNNSHTLIIYIYDDSFSYQIDFEDDTMTWTHYYNGLPDITTLYSSPQK